MSVANDAKRIARAPGHHIFQDGPRARFGFHTDRTGFTLIELLVVIAVIAMLAAILFPVFLGAKEKSRQATCISNLKQISSAWQLYADSNNGRACPSYQLSNGQIAAWDFASTSSGYVLGLLGDYTRSRALYSCPSYHLPIDYSGDGRPYTGFAYNASYIGGDVNLSTGKPYIDPVTKLPKNACLIGCIAQPSHTVVFADAGFDKPVQPLNYLRAPGDTQLFTAGTVHFRHNGYASVAWADGHVSAINKNYRSYTNNNYVPENPECGALSRDDSAYDLK